MQTKSCKQNPNKLNRTQTNTNQQTLNANNNQVSTLNHKPVKVKCPKHKQLPQIRTNK